jgi:hypothetical protein
MSKNDHSALIITHRLGRMLVKAYCLVYVCIPKLILTAGPKSRMACLNSNARDMTY